MTPVLLRNNCKIGLAKSLIKINCFLKWKGISNVSLRSDFWLQKKGNDAQRLRIGWAFNEFSAGTKVQRCKQPKFQRPAPLAAIPMLPACAFRQPPM